MSPYSPPASRVAPAAPTAEDLAAEARAKEEAERRRAEYDRIEAEDRKRRDEEYSRQLAEARRKAISDRAGQMLRLAQSLEKQGKFRGALSGYRDLVDDFPDEPQAKQADARIKALSRSPDFSRSTAYPIVSVVDHMTVLASIAGKETQVRLHGIEPFPKGRPKSLGSSYEDRAVEHLKGLLEGRSIFVAHDAGVSMMNGDLMVVYVYRSDDKLFVNRRMIADGYASPSAAGIFSHGEDFRDAGARAKARGFGIWAGD